MVVWLAGLGNAEVTRIWTFAFPGLPAENHHKLNCPVDLRIRHILEGIQCKPVQPWSDFNKLNTTTTPPPAPPFSAIICHHPSSPEVTGCRHRTDATRPVVDPSRDGRKFPCLCFSPKLFGGHDRGNWKIEKKYQKYYFILFVELQAPVRLVGPFLTDVFSKTITGKTTSSWPCLPEMIPTWSLTARPWKVAGIQKERIVFQPSFSMVELLNFRDVPNFWSPPATPHNLKVDVLWFPTISYVKKWFICHPIERTMYKWVFPKNRGTPKWMVKIMENPIKMDDSGVPLF